MPADFDPSGQTKKRTGAVACFMLTESSFHRVNPVGLYKNSLLQMNAGIFTVIFCDLFPSELSSNKAGLT